MSKFVFFSNHRFPESSRELNNPMSKLWFANARSYTLASVSESGPLSSKSSKVRHMGLSRNLARAWIRSALLGNLRRNCVCACFPGQSRNAHQEKTKWTTAQHTTYGGSRATAPTSNARDNHCLTIRLAHKRNSVSVLENFQVICIPSSTTPSRTVRRTTPRP